MKVEKYSLKAESTLTIFEFINEGQKGNIRKLIQFQETNEPGSYNLAFGDKDLSTGEMDDLVVSKIAIAKKYWQQLQVHYMPSLMNIRMPLFMQRVVQKQGQGFTGWASLGFIMMWLKILTSMVR